MPSLSVIIPAFNEAAYLPQTLAHLAASQRHLAAACKADVQIVVVDNASTDRTAEVARCAGAIVVGETEHNIGKVRNVGAALAQGDILVFLDADTLVPPELLLAIVTVMTDPACAGGSVDLEHHVRGAVLRVYFGFWRLLGLLGGMAQGACQFCRKALFEEMGGYDETQFMGEDVDFYWRLKRLARRHALRTAFIGECRVIPSPRRFDQWPVWRTLVFTNPLFCFVLRHRKTAWKEWYTNPPR